MKTWFDIDNAVGNLKNTLNAFLNTPRGDIFFIQFCRRR